MARDRNARRKTARRPAQPAAPANLTPAVLAGMQEGFEAEPAYEVIQNAVTSVSAASLARHRKVVTAIDHSFLNIDMALMKRIAMRTLSDGEPVWFGCDVGKQMDRDLGLWDADLLDYDRLYDTTFEMSKASRLEYGAAFMTHAMLLTGVDVKGGKPRRWRVENSWGDKGGKEGFFAMNDSWFDEHMFEIAARRKYLPAKLREALDRKPIVLPPWDPMGSLARWAACHPCTLLKPGCSPLSAPRRSGALTGTGSS